jgi:hypothetical protein
MAAGSMASTRASASIRDKQVGAVAMVNGRGNADGLAMSRRSPKRPFEPRTAIAPPPPMPGTYRPLLGIYLDLEDGWLVRVEWRDGNCH